MNEATRFWGVGTPNAFRDSSLLRWWSDVSSPRSKVYPVFDSREEAEDYVRDAYVRGTRDTDIGSPALQDTLKAIRVLRRDEIPLEQNVWHARRGLVTWGELLGEG